ncbi:MAG: hypothetical protein JST54_05720 [Deltaproteobacteria bacterium]|nr:hypothetical protein [Deltaproteobacteria bacterium]
MHVILIALLATGATDKPDKPNKPNKTWWCPTGPCHLGFWLQCRPTEDDCNGLVQSTDQNAANYIRPCVEKHTVWCLSYRPLGGSNHYLPAETYCHDTLKHCQVDEADVKKNQKHKDLKSCAKQP